MLDYRDRGIKRRDCDIWNEVSANCKIIIRRIRADRHETEIRLDSEMEGMQRMGGKKRVPLEKARREIKQK